MPLNVLLLGEPSGLPDWWGFRAIFSPHGGRAIKSCLARKPCIHAATKNPADGYHAAWAGTKSMGKCGFSTIFFGFYRVNADFCRILGHRISETRIWSGFAAS
jgi:hypothetical protein